jgi:hypothetical protein
LILVWHLLWVILFSWDINTNKIRRSQYSIIYYLWLVKKMRKIVLKWPFRIKLQARNWSKWMLEIWKSMLEQDFSNLSFSILWLRIGYFQLLMHMLLIWSFIVQSRKWLLIYVKIQELLLGSWKKEIFRRKSSMRFLLMLMTTVSLVFKACFAINSSVEKIWQLNNTNKNCKKTN